MFLSQAFAAPRRIYGAGDRRTRRAMWAAVILIPVAVAVMVGVLGWKMVESRRAEAELRSALETRLAIEHVRALVTDAETAQRGYLLTGDTAYLVPFNEARPALRTLAKDLRAAFADDEVQSARLISLAAVAGAKFDELRETIALRREGRAAEAMVVIDSGRGRHLMERMRGLLAEMTRDQTLRISALLEREQQIDTTATAALWALLTGLVALLVGTAVFTLRLFSSLVDRKAQAEQASRSKSDFLAMMSHELRTPMNGVLGMAHMLEQGDLSEEQSRQIQTLQASGRGLMVVLNDILDLSKIEADRIDLELQAFDLASQVQETAELWRPGAALKDLAFTVEVTTHDYDGQFLGDATRLRQIIGNLISNAVKFTAHGAVRIHVIVGEGAVDGLHPVSVAVSDTGPGIDAETAARLFAPFSQGDSSVSRRYGGTGLGLAISRKLARLMGGDVALSSQPGCGSTFTLMIALAAVTGQAAVPDEESALPDLEGLRILVAEDNPNNQAVVRAYLHAMTANFEIVDDGAQALAALCDGRFDLVLMDMQMPVMNGLQATAAIRRGEAGDPAIPVIALTADAMTGDRERFLAQGFDDYIAKPIDPRTFIHTIGSALRASRLRRPTEIERAA